MNNRWKTSKSCVYNLGYHLIWCPKYRKPVLVNNVEIRLKELLKEKETKMDIIIEKMEVMEDHIHLFVKTKPTHAPHWVVQQLKGYTSKKLRNEFDHLRTKMPSLWTRSYYCESIGNISDETIKKYIENQKNV